MVTTRGGRIPPANRPAQTPGVGKRSKRHDLERRSTPYLHGSDLQQGDVQALEQGQRIAPRQTQRPAAAAAPARTTAAGPGQDNMPFEVPDPVDFIISQAGGTGITAPSPQVGLDGGKLETWRPIIEKMVSGPGSSGLLAAAYINQLRQMRTQRVARQAVTIDLESIDEGIEAMVDEMGRE